MPFVERSYYQSGYIATDYYETTIEFVGISLPSFRLPEGDAYLLITSLTQGTPSIERYSWNHSSSIVDGVPYDPIISSIGNLEKSLIDGSGSIGVRLTPTIGNIVIDLENGRNLPLTKKQWADQTFSLYRGPRYGPESLLFANFKLIYRGRYKGHTYNEEFMELVVGDSSSKLNEKPTPFSGSGVPGGGIYIGTGIEQAVNAPDLVGKPQPRTFGTVYLISPTLLDFNSQIYDVGFRRIVEVVALYDSMNLLSFAGNHSLEALINTTPTPGTYITDTMDGLIKLGAVPVGRLSANVFGDYDTGFRVRNERMIRILRNVLGLYAQGLNVDNLSLTQLEFLTEQIGLTGGFYLGPDDERMLADIIDFLCHSVGAVWMMSNNDLIEFKRFGFDFGTQKVMTDEGVLRRSRELPLPPAWRIEVKYQRNHNVHLQSDLTNPAITDQLRSFALNEWRVNDHEDPDILSTRSDARILTVETALNTQSVQLLLLLIGLHQVERDIITLTVQDRNWQYEIGETVFYDSELLDIEKYMIVVKINERISQRQTDLTLWG